MKSNWAGNINFNSRNLAAPESVEEIRDLVRGVARVKVLSGGHSFSPIADTDSLHLSLRNFSAIEIDRSRSTVSIGAGVNYAALSEALHQAGYAVHNLASLPHISVAGACATATHGSGDGNGNLATAVTALTMVTANGGILRLRRGEPRFDGAVVGLGALGVVTELELEIRPSFDVAQRVYEGASYPSIVQSFDRIMSSGYSVSIFTGWKEDSGNQIWVKGPNRPDTSDPSVFGVPATAHRHPLAGLSAECCTPQMGESGPWHERLPHFKIGFTPSAGAELQSEFFVARASAPDAIQSLLARAPGFSDLVQVTELRSIAADSLWMSPAYGRNIIGIHFTWHKREHEVLDALRTVVEPALGPYRAVPHWGKLFTAASVRDLYPRFDDFAALMRELGGIEKFGNEFLRRYLG